MMTLGLGLFCLAVTAARGEVIWDRSTDMVVERGIEVPPEEFTIDQLIVIGMSYLKKSEAQIIHLTFVAPGQSLMLFQPSHLSYSAWLQNYKRAVSTPVRVAEMISVRGNAVLRFRSGFSISRTTLSGRDPLIYPVLRSTCEILHVVQTPFVIHPLRVYIRCSEDLTRAVAEELYGRLLEVFPRGTYAELRTDSWFFDLGFPQAYWYDLMPAPEDRAAVFAAPRVTCYSWRNRDSACAGEPLEAR